MAQPYERLDMAIKVQVTTQLDTNAATSMYGLEQECSSRVIWVSLYDKTHYRKA